MKRSKMTVGERMTSRVVTVSPGDSLAAACEEMSKGRFRALPVVKKGRLVGILSDRDVLPFIGHKSEISVKEAMTKAVVTVAPETPLTEAARLFLRYKIDALPVARDGDLVGIVTSTDILAAYVALAGVSRRNESTSPSRMAHL